MKEDRNTYSNIPIINGFYYQISKKVDYGPIIVNCLSMTSSHLYIFGIYGFSSIKDWSFNLLKVYFLCFYWYSWLIISWSCELFLFERSDFFFISESGSYRSSTCRNYLRALSSDSFILFDYFYNMLFKVV